MDQIELYNRLNQLLESFEEDKTIQALKKAKKELYRDKQLEKLLSKYHRLQENPYSKEYIELRKELFANPAFRAYQNCENELSYLILEINRQLEQLTKGD